MTKHTVVSLEDKGTVASATSTCSTRKDNPPPCARAVLCTRVGRIECSPTRKDLGIDMPLNFVREYIATAAGQGRPAAARPQVALHDRQGKVRIGTLRGTQTASFFGFRPP